VHPSIHQDNSPQRKSTCHKSITFSDPDAPFRDPSALIPSRAQNHKARHTALHSVLMRCACRKRQHPPSTEKPCSPPLRPSAPHQPSASPGGLAPAEVSPDSSTDPTHSEDSSSGYATPPRISTLAQDTAPIHHVDKRRRRRIGVGVDGSKGCAAALSWALKNMYHKQDIIVLINCQSLQFIPGAGYGSSATLAALEEKAKENGKK
jgi:hypothetical protein